MHGAQIAVLSACLSLTVTSCTGPTAVGETRPPAARADPAGLLEPPRAAIDDAPAMARAMRDLARQILASYRDADREADLRNRFRLQMVAGRWPQAVESIVALRELRRPRDPVRHAWTDVQFEIYARARARELAGASFDRAYAHSFRDIIGRLDDRTSAMVVRTLAAGDQIIRQGAFRSTLDRVRGSRQLSIDDALALIGDYQVEEAYRSTAALTPVLVAADDQRRYIVEREIAVKTPQGATICTLVVRPRTSAERLPALLTFTIYADPVQNLSEARRAASRGYVGVVGLTRGKGCSPGRPVPYEHDGADAAALIEWIAAQPWSDRRVAMYGGSYSGFTPWAAAKHRPAALKAMMVGAPVAPGIDVPMEGNVPWNFVYPWVFYAATGKGVDDATYKDAARWQRMTRAWYASGRAHRELEEIDGTPNPIFGTWLAHPSYDSYWRRMIPYREEFARIDIPVLTTAGYYYGGPGAAVYYFTEHQKHAARAEHYLLIGPYDHFGGQRGTVGLLGGDSDTLAGYRLDRVARMDMGELRYEWFDHVLRGGPRPALLRDKVNYQVTGANVWKHAPTIAAMANDRMRLHLDAERSGAAHRLSQNMPAGRGFVVHTVDLADRSDADRQVPGGGVSDRALDTWNALLFASEPLESSIELSGLFSGRLDLVANKRDFDFQIALYEQTPGGDYIQLAPYLARASFVRDLGRRRTLRPGRRERLEFRAVRLMSRRLQAGSRIVALLTIVKDPGLQINYGTGKDVSTETIRDAGQPLEIKCYSTSFLDLPLSR
jgi:uncharacterized protein